MQDVVWAQGASITPNIGQLGGQRGNGLAYTQDASTGRLIVVQTQVREGGIETEIERENVRK